ncbi:MAG: DcrB-related protein [Candidatus Desantisbacteria bacterium]
MPYYFKREQFYKDSTQSEQTESPVQKPEQKPIEEKIEKKEGYFFSKEQFSKEKPSPSKEEKKSEISELQPEPDIQFHANKFTINLFQEWQDKTIYTLIGPDEDDLQHNIIITVDEDVQADSVSEYADQQIEALEEQLQGCRLLKKGTISLTNGMEAYEAIFCWDPTNIQRVYQQQVYVLFKSVGYKITATFSKKSRKTKGLEIDRILKSFNPKK